MLRKGLPPTTHAYVQPEQKQQLGAVFFRGQLRGLTILPIDESQNEHVERKQCPIDEGQKENVERKQCPSVVMRLTPAWCAPAVSSSSSGASSSSRDDEIRAQLRRLVTPCIQFVLNRLIVGAQCWPMGNRLCRTITTSPTITTNAAPAPAAAAAPATAVDGRHPFDRALEVVLAERARDDPLLFSNLARRANAIVGHDPNFNAFAVGPSIEEMERKEKLELADVCRRNNHERTQRILRKALPVRDRVIWRIDLAIRRLAAYQTAIESTERNAAVMGIDLDDYTPPEQPVVVDDDCASDSTLTSDGIDITPEPSPPLKPEREPFLIRYCQRNNVSILTALVREDRKRITLMDVELAARRPATRALTGSSDSTSQTVPMSPMTLCSTASSDPDRLYTIDLPAPAGKVNGAFSPRAYEANVDPRNRSDNYDDDTGVDDGCAIESCSTLDNAIAIQGWNTNARQRPVLPAGRPSSL